jgi:hypothetical protein
VTTPQATETTRSQPGSLSSTLSAPVQKPPTRSLQKPYSPPSEGRPSEGRRELRPAPLPTDSSDTDQSTSTSTVGPPATTTTDSSSETPMPKRRKRDDVPPPPPPPPPTDTTGTFGHH